MKILILFTVFFFAFFFVFYTSALAYDLTTQDNLLITKASNKINWLIQQKWEIYRDKYIQTLNNFLIKKSDNERLKAVIKGVINNLHVSNNMKIIKRDEVGDEYKWKLTDIFKNEVEIEDSIKTAKELIIKLGEYKWKLSDDAKLLEYLKLNSEFNKDNDRRYGYSDLWESLNIKDAKISELSQKFNSVYLEYQKSTAFFGVEVKIFSDDKIASIIKNPDFKEYKNIFEQIQKQKSHILSQDQEDIIAALSDSYIWFSTTYSKLIDGDIIYPQIIDPEWNKISTNYINMYSTWHNANREFRKNYTDKYYNTYKSYKNVLGALAVSNLKESSAYAKIRKYDSVLQSKYQKNDLSVDMYDNLINITRQNLGVFHRYLKVRQNYLWLDKTHYYDTFTPIENNVKNYFTYKGSQEIILKWLSKLWKEYLSGITKAYESNWIDVYSWENKTWWAFCYGSFSIHPFVLLNFNNTYDDVSTMAHELWHAMNFYFISEKQPYNLAEIIFPVEVPSIANELIILRWLADNAKSDREKLFYLDRYLGLIYTNYWRATMYWDYEKQVYTKIWNNEPVTVETLEKIFQDLFKTYYWPDFAYDDYLDIEWAIKPHFFNPYYTHEYAISAAAANKIATSINNEEQWFTQKYIDYISSWKSRTPNELLSKIGIDLTKPEYIKSVAETQTKILDEMEEIISRINKK